MARKAARQGHWSNVEILQQATSINGELLQLTGVLNPYPKGPFGVIQEGGNPSPAPAAAPKGDAAKRV